MTWSRTPGDRVRRSVNRAFVVVFLLGLGSAAFAVATALGWIHSSEPGGDVIGIIGGVVGAFASFGLLRHTLGRRRRGELDAYFEGRKDPFDRS